MPQTTQQYRKAWISLSSPSQSFLPPAPSRRKAGLATDWELTCNFYRSSQWVGEKCNRYNKMKGRKDTGIYACWKDIYLLSSILFYLSFLFVQFLSEDRDLLWTASEDVWEDVFFFFFLRQGPQHDQWKWFGFIWCLFCFIFCCLDCEGMAYQIKITSIQCSPEGECVGMGIVKILKVLIYLILPWSHTLMVLLSAPFVSY